MAAESGGGEKIGGIYITIGLDSSDLKRDTEAMKSYVRREMKKTETAHAKLKMNFENAVAKMKITEIQKLKQKLDAEFTKKVEMNVSGASLENTRIKLNTVNSALKDIKSSADRAETSTKSFTEKMMTGLKALGAAIAVKAIFDWFKQSVAMGIEASRSVAKVEQAIRTTGGAAGWTGLQLQRMAAELQDITGIGDDTILNDVTAQLLTFTNVSGEAFKRAQVAAMDLSAVIGNDLKSQTIQLGKALEDPIAGIGALSRAGVTFTQVQKEMIQNFMAQGDLAAAQSVILDEIEKKYGGQARAMSEASAGTMQLSEAWGDLREAIGQALTPLLTWLMPKITEAIKGWIILLSDTKEKFRDILKLSAADAKEGLRNAVKGMTAEMAKKNVLELEVKIEANRAKWGEIDRQITELMTRQYRDTGTGRMVKDEGVTETINKLWAEQKKLSSESQSFRNNVQALEELILSTAEAAKVGTEAFSKQGKTLGELQDRYDRLATRFENLVPGTDEFQKTKAEMTDLKNLIEDLTNAEGSSGGVNITSVLDQKKAAERKYYEDVKFLDAGYYAWKIGQYRTEASELKRVLGGKFNEQVWFAERTKALDDELLRYLTDNREKLPEYLQLKPGEGGESAGMPQFPLTGAIGGEMKRRDGGEDPWYEGKAINPAQVMQEWVDSSVIGKTAFDEFGSAVADTFSLIQIRLSESASAMEKIWAGMINAMLSKLMNLLAQWLIFNTIAAIIPDGGGFGAVGFKSLLGIPGAASGGDFAGTAGGVRRLASGGDFVVPTGFSNDSYPLLVQSGERVQVTPAHRTGDENYQLMAINNSIQALNMNLTGMMRKQPVIVINNDITERRLVKNMVLPGERKLKKEGLNLT